MTKKTDLELYLLADGTHAKPSDCEPDADGVLRHIYGMAVALNGDGEPETVNQGAVDNKNVEAAEAAAQPVTEVAPATGKPAEQPEPEPAQVPPKAKEVQAEPAKTFKNREAKSK